MDTKSEIYKKALEIFTKRGYDNTPMSHIAKALGVTKAALYHHFPSKEGLLYFIIDRMTEERFMPILDEAEKIPDPENRLTYFVKHYAKLLTEDATAKIIIHEARRLAPQDFKKIKKTYRRAFDLLKTSISEIQASHHSKKLNPSFVAFAAIGMCSWTFYWFDYTRKDSREELADTFLEVLFKGIAPEE